MKLMPKVLAGASIAALEPALVDQLTKAGYRTDAPSSAGGQIVEHVVRHDVITSRIEERPDGRSIGRRRQSRLVGRRAGDRNRPLEAARATNPNPEDFEPDGTWYSMIAVRGALYAVEPNHGELDKITTGGEVSRVADISATLGHIVPTAVDFHGNFYVGNVNTFPIQSGSSKILKINPAGYVQRVASGLTTVLGWRSTAGIACMCSRIRTASRSRHLAMATSCALIPRARRRSWSMAGPADCDNLRAGRGAVRVELGLRAAAVVAERARHGAADHRLLSRKEHKASRFASLPEVLNPGE